MIPELDHHTPTASNPTPLTSRFSPWHACGTDYPAYSAGMKRTQHLSLEGCILRLQPGDADHEAAARQWEDVFGVARSRDLLAFTNARVGFVPGKEGESEGLVSITVGVRGKEELEGIRERARERGVWGEKGVEMCGVLWYFISTGQGEVRGKL